MDRSDADEHGDGDAHRHHHQQCVCTRGRMFNFHVLGRGWMIVLGWLSNVEQASKSKKGSVSLGVCECLRQLYDIVVSFMLVSNIGRVNSRPISLALFLLFMGENVKIKTDVIIM